LSYIPLVIRVISYIPLESEEQRVDIIQRPLNPLHACAKRCNILAHVPNLPPEGTYGLVVCRVSQPALVHNFADTDAPSGAVLDAGLGKDLCTRLLLAPSFAVELDCQRYRGKVEAAQGIDCQVELAVQFRQPLCRLARDRVCLGT
jgi:hypothetical protein